MTRVFHNSTWTGRGSWWLHRSDMRGWLNRADIRFMRAGVEAHEEAERAAALARAERIFVLQIKSALKAANLKPGRMPRRRPATVAV